MFSLTSKTTAFITAGTLAIGLPLYGIYSTRTQLDDRVSSIEHELQIARAQNSAKIQDISTDLNYIAEKLEITTKDLEQARKTAETAKEENAQYAQSAKRLRTELATSSKALDRLRKDEEAVHQDVNAKFGAVDGAMQNVRGDIDATKTDLAANRKEISDVRDSLTLQIAHNSAEVAELRRRGERDYVEFDIRKSRDMERIADVKVQLKKTDTKRQKFDVVFLIDDSKIERKDRVVNEPIIFIAGKDRARYEFVVNNVDKDRIRGYLSTPKDKVLAAENPGFRPK
jgi:chromosome segregation ATPase